jgi:hypothetical protein
MGRRTTVLLLLIILGVGAVLWIEEPPPEVPAQVPNLLGEPRLRDPSDFVPLLPFQPAETVTIRIRSGDVDFSAQRSAEGWTGSGRQSRIEDFLRNLSDLGRITEIPAAEGDLAEYGLQNAGIVLELSLAGEGAPLVLEIGDQNPAGTGIYARVNRRGPVILAGSLLSWEIDKLLRSGIE